MEATTIYYCTYWGMNIQYKALSLIFWLSQGPDRMLQEYRVGRMQARNQKKSGVAENYCMRSGEGGNTCFNESEAESEGIGE